MRRPRVPQLLRIRQAGSQCRYGEALLTHTMTEASYQPLGRLFDSIGFPATMDPAMQVHMVVTDEGNLVSSSLWENDQRAAEFYAAQREHLDGLLSESPGMTISREKARVINVALGPDAERYRNTVVRVPPGVRASIFEAVPGSQQVYEMLAEAAKLNDDHPDGLILHVAAVTEIGVRGFDVWQSPKHARAFLEQRLMPAGLAVAQAIGDIPAIRPRDSMVHLFAINERLFDATT